MICGGDLGETIEVITYSRIENPRFLNYMRLSWLLIAAANLLLLIVGIFEGVDISNPQYERIVQYLQDPQAYREQFRFLFNITYVVLGVLAFALGSIIFVRRSNDRVAILLALMLVIVPLNASSFSMTLAKTVPTWKALAMFVWVVSMSSVHLFFLTFPTGHFYPRFTRYLLVFIVGWEFYRLQRYLNDENPPTFLFLTTIILWGLGIAMQVYRYRNKSSRIERQQTKWIILGVSIGVFCSFIAIFGIDKLPPLLSEEALVNGVAALSNFMFIGMIGFILSIAFSITQRGLWEIDLTINRSLVYGVVAILLAFVFAGGVFILQSLFGEENATVAMTISAVGAGVLFNPTRKKIQNIIDRHVYGFRFDLNELQRGQQKPVIGNPGLFTGRTMGKYELLGVVGKGGMGEVYKGYGDGKTVAIKILAEIMTLQKVFIQRFEREADALTSLNHPNIVEMYGSGKSDGTHYMAMQFIDGHELRERIMQGAMSLEDSFDVLSGLADALDYAHKQGLVHRDIKPSNVMLKLNDDNETYRAILMDFGIAKMQDARTNITGTGAVGTIEYMAPEQIQESHVVDCRADIYAVGVMLYEMLTGKHPFQGNPAHILFAHLQQPAPDASLLVPGIPPKVAKAVMQAMAKDPEDRFQSAGELVQAISYAG
jgi:predicted Ser/Thr protein kinase